MRWVGRRKGLKFSRAFKGVKYRVKTTQIYDPAMHLKMYIWQSVKERTRSLFSLRF